MTLFQVLSMNERVIVWSDEEQSLIVTWNQSATLQAWNGSRENWSEVDIRTLTPTMPFMTFDVARAAAKRWLEEGY